MYSCNSKGEILFFLKKIQVRVKHYSTYSLVLRGLLNNP